MAKETLLQVKGSTKGITLSGERDGRGKWRWWVDGEKDGEESREWDDWPDVMLALDEDPWEEYEPIAVHPEFRSKIWGAVLQRATDPAGLVPWFRVCFPRRSGAGSPGNGRKSVRCPAWRRRSPRPGMRWC